MTKPFVTLTANQAFNAACGATMQMLRTVKLERTSDHGGTSDRSQKERWADAFTGALYEQALSEITNQAWTPGGQQISTGDVGHKLESRGTHHRGGHLLLYKDKDKLSSLFALLIGEWPTYQCVGAIYGRDGCKPEYWNYDAKPPCWWIPQNKLDDLDTFIELPQLGRKPNGRGFADPGSFVLPDKEDV